METGDNEKNFLYPFSVPVQNMSFLETEILFYSALSEVPLLQEKNTNLVFII